MRTHPFVKFLHKLDPYLLFNDVKIMGDTPFVEKKIPENPVWMKQPDPKAPKPWWLQPIKFKV